VANELVGQCSSTVILRLNSPETAAWASRLLGTREVLESRRGQTRNYQPALKSLAGTGDSVSHGVAARALVLDSEIMDLPETS
jgi:type IV secretory pathway TraG/TraD family ATPase VirD4